MAAGADQCGAAPFCVAELGAAVAESGARRLRGARVRARRQERGERGGERLRVSRGTVLRREARPRRPCAAGARFRAHVAALGRASAKSRLAERVTNPGQARELPTLVSHVQLQEEPSAWKTLPI
jgi:hypothetical protein